MKSLYWKIVWLMQARLFIDRGRDIGNTIFLAGIQRSGTTWAARVISYDQSFRFIWEPFWADRVPACRGLRLYAYMRPGQPYPKEDLMIQRVLEGRVRSRFSDAYNRRFFSHRRLIKEVRGNLMMKWMADLYPNMPMVLLIGHPFAVASSMLQLGWTVDPHVYLSQPELVRDYLHDKEIVIDHLTDDFDGLIFHWCVQHYVPLSQFASDRLLVMHYENLYDHPEEYVPDLFEYLGRSYDETVYDFIMFNAHHKDRNHAFRHSSSIHKWRRIISKDQMLRGAEILDAFNLREMYDEEGNPVPAAFQAGVGRGDKSCPAEL